MNRTDTFISNVYRAVHIRGTENFRESTLRSLRILIPFDGALWGSGDLDEQFFHSVATLGIDGKYPKVLEKARGSNPLLPLLLERVGTAVRTSDLISDDKLYASKIYKRYAARFGIERSMIYIDFDQRSRTHTFINLYRFDRDNDFTKQECELFERSAFHMAEASHHALSRHIDTEADNQHDEATAICDSYGVFYEAQPAFMQLLKEHYPKWEGESLPITIPEAGATLVENGLCLTADAYGDLFCLHLWQERPTDNLEELDREIVNSVCKGMTFKEIGRVVNKAPSTVSSRLYRIYQKLGVSSRAALARMVREQGHATPKQGKQTL